MGQQLTILLVEDDEVETMSITRSLRRAGIDVPIETASNGRRALDRLRTTGDGAIRYPFVVLLDINMPEMNGHDFLAELRADECLHSAVVFMLTTSADAVDVSRAYNRQVAGYIVKTDLDPDYRQLIELLQAYASVVRMPEARTRAVHG